MFDSHTKLCSSENSLALLYTYKPSDRLLQEECNFVWILNKFVLFTGLCFSLSILHLCRNFKCFNMYIFCINLYLSHSCFCLCSAKIGDVENNIRVNKYLSKRYNKHLKIFFDIYFTSIRTDLRIAFHNNVWNSNQGW